MAHETVAVRLGVGFVVTIFPKKPWTRGFSPLPEPPSRPARLWSTGAMTAIARLAAVSLDCSDPSGLATFYRELLDLEPLFESDDMIALKGAAILLTVQRVAEHQPAEWPTGAVPKQIHLELAVQDLESAASAAIALGATIADSQPNPDHWRVLIDPAGHPFCMTTLIPDD